jgi:hypothetical protein
MRGPSSARAHPPPATSEAAGPSGTAASLDSAAPVPAKLSMNRPDPARTRPWPETIRPDAWTIRPGCGGARPVKGTVRPGLATVRPGSGAFRRKRGNVYASGRALRASGRIVRTPGRAAHEPGRTVRPSGRTSRPCGFLAEARPCASCKPGRRLHRRVDNRRGAWLLCARLLCESIVICSGASLGLRLQTGCGDARTCSLTIDSPFPDEAGRVRVRRRTCPSSRVESWSARRADSGRYPRCS